MMLNISITQMEYIVAVDTHRHFVTAAEHCFVTQPTLSMQIKKLEDQLGVTIFDRTKQPIIPTDAGAKIIAQSRTVLNEVERINDILQDYRETVSGELKVGIIPTIAPYLIPRFIGNFYKAFPNVKLTIKEMLTDNILKSLKNDTLDVAILVTPLDEAEVEEIPLFYEELFLYFNEQHINQIDTPITPEYLKGERIWLLSEGHCFRNQMLNICKISKNNSLPGFEFESGSLETLRKIVDTEGGFTVLPELGTEGIKAEQLKVMGEQKQYREISMIYTRNFAKKKLIKLLEEELKKSVPESMLSANGGNIVEWK
ncbi:hydrogen peroxide-inducible genes activator [Persicobacter psychrovividus]|uniref:Transcriptional regulator n=1 Tax=Persicobacter psychrovividus TaxID=387638 RepID=A0ABN6LD81_9BACT|nr:transcriptional regulator [Persicobacter psychrovividus]